MINHSIRWKLSLSFAGIALLTTLALGLVLLWPLQAYYRGQERSYLEGNAASIAVGLSMLFSQDTPQAVDLETHIKFLSFLSQVRVRLVDMQGELIADSGSPELSGAVNMSTVNEGEAVAGRPAPVVATGGLIVRLEPTASMYGYSPSMDWVAGEQVLVPPAQQDFTTQPLLESTPAAGALPMTDEANLLQPNNGLRFYHSQGGPEGSEAAYGFTTAMDTILISQVPVSSSMYGFALFNDPVNNAARSGQVFRAQVPGADGQQVAWVELSEGPAYGREIVTNVARAWALASFVAVLVAAIVGWWISRRMSAPVMALTAVTRQMASGDLSARASLPRADEYGMLGRAFNEMAARVEDTVSMLRRFAADAAHELHTPLTALRTNLELAQVTPDPNEYLMRAAEQVARMEHLTRELLDLSRVEGGASDLQPVRFDLRSLVAMTCEPFAAQAEQAEIDFCLATPSEPVWVVGQEGRLRQAVANLAENALKFTPPGGRVGVGLSVEAGRAVLWVEDTGIGIAAEDLPALFQRFHRGRNASGYPGSGLGLSIVKAVAEAHGGMVTAESAPGRTRFTMEIPLDNERHAG